MISGILDQFGDFAHFFTTGSGIVDATTDYVGDLFWVIGGNLGNWGS